MEFDDDDNNGFQGEDMNGEHDTFQMIFSPALVEKLQGKPKEEESKSIESTPNVTHTSSVPTQQPKLENSYTSLRRLESAAFEEIENLLSSLPEQNQQTKQKDTPCTMEEMEVSKCLQKSRNITECNEFIDKFTQCMKKAS